jgi:selenocysteine lyase/cysteine desulfurase
MNKRHFLSAAGGASLGLTFNTPKDAKRACAIANVGVQGMTPGDLARTLLERFKVYTVAIDGAGVHGVRVTPQVYTSTADLDTFVHALTQLAA